MTLKVQHKRSAVSGKAPLPADLDFGEIAVNYHASGPAIYVKDTAGAIRKIGSLTGALVFKGSKAPGDAAPGTPASGDVWVMSAAGTMAASWTGVAGLAVVKDETIAWDGSEWISLGIDPPTPDATETVKGIVELATAAETTTGTDNTRAVHPAGLKVELDKKVDLAGDTMTGALNLPNLVATGDVQSTSQNGGQLAGFRNQIINGDFRIWQRGASYSGVTTGVFTADRWYAQSASLIGNSGDAYLRAAKEAGNGLPGFAFAFHPVGVAKSLIHQPIETSNYNQPYAAGTTWTVSWYEAKGAVDAATIAFANDHTNTSAINPVTAAAGSHNLIPNAVDIATVGVWKRRSSTFTITEDGNTSGNSKPCLNLVIGCTTASNYMTGIQLEPGPVATPFEHRPIGIELALCQRYYFEGYLAEYAGTSPYSSSYAFWVDFPVPMRVFPTITGTGKLHNDNLGTSTTTPVNFDGKPGNAGTRVFMANDQPWTGTAASPQHGNPIIGATVFLKLDAEL